MRSHLKYQYRTKDLLCCKRIVLGTPKLCAYFKCVKKLQTFTDNPELSLSSKYETLNAAFQKIEIHYLYGTTTLIRFELNEVVYVTKNQVSSRTTPGFLLRIDKMGICCKSLHRGCKIESMGYNENRLTKSVKPNGTRGACDE